jgi:hypothetical protein
MSDKDKVVPFLVPTDEGQRTYHETQGWFRTQLFDIVDEAMKGRLSSIDFIDALLSAATYVHMKALNRPDEFEARVRSAVATAYHEIIKIQGGE